MYKKDIHRIEDAIIPFILEGVMQMYGDKSFKETIGLLQSDVMEEIRSKPKLTNRLSRVEKKLLTHFRQNNWKTNKIFMIILGISLIGFGLGIILDPDFYDSKHQFHYDFSEIRFPFGGFLVVIGSLS